MTAPEPATGQILPWFVARRLLLEEPKGPMELYEPRARSHDLRQRERSMIHPRPVVLERDGIRLEPMTVDHHDALVRAAADGELWNLWFTSVPAPGATRRYIDDALEGQRAGHMLPWVVRELASGTVVGSHAIPRHRRRASIASRSATRGTRRAGSARASTPCAS